MKKIIDGPHEVNVCDVCERPCNLTFCCRICSAESGACCNRLLNEGEAYSPCKLIFPVCARCCDRSHRKAIHDAVEAANQTIASILADWKQQAAQPVGASR